MVVVGRVVGVCLAPCQIAIVVAEHLRALNIEEIWCWMSQKVFKIIQN